MTKTAIRKIPSGLTHARVYLDDLFEIESILLEEYAKLPEAPLVSFEYLIDDILAMTTHEELIEHGGNSARFTLNVTSANWRYSEGYILILNDMVRPQFSVPRALREQQWAIFGKVEQVFKARADRFKNGVEATPVSALILLSLSCFALSVLLNIFHRGKIESSIVLTILGLLLTLFIAGSIGVWRKNRIYFRYARQDQKARTAARNERIEKFLWLCFGAFLGAVGALVVDRFKH